MASPPPVFPNNSNHGFSETAEDVNLQKMFYEKTEYHESNRIKHGFGAVIEHIINPADLKTVFN